MAGLQSVFNRVEDQNSELLDQTIQAIRSALQSGLKVLFMIGFFALLVALLFILTIPEVSLDNDVQDRKSGP